ncbi:DinB family protein [Nocardia sp. NPDC051570]|uniref:DinB family protein n=1 Tax=Nocardia sp. NPDC051570 TaxID=3364324 RepID=UPI00379BA331
MTASTASTAAGLDTEKAELLTELALARTALINCTRGLGDEQAGARPTASTLSVGALVKHVASTEAEWMRFVAGDPTAMRFDLPDGVTWADLAAGTARRYPQWAIDHENDFRMLPGDTLAEILARYERVAADTEQIIAAAPDLSATRPLPEAPWLEPGAARSIRRVLVHVIAETAQHAGHADILRESIDGHKNT